MKHRASARIAPTRLIATTAILLVLSSSAYALPASSDIAASTTGAALPADGDTVQDGVTIDNSDTPGDPTITTQDNTTLTNSGTITSVSGSSKDAITDDGSDDGDGVTITNNAGGVIQALGSGDAIKLDDDVTIVNKGTIFTAGGESAIELDKDGDVTNSGTITGATTPAAGDNSYVLRVDRGTILNQSTGIIEATGDATTLDGSGNNGSNIYAIRAGHDDPTTVTNYGIVRATGDAASVEQGNDEGEVGAIRLENGSSLANYGTVETTGSIVTGADTNSDPTDDGYEIGDMYGVRIDDDGGSVHNYGTGIIRGGKHGITVDKDATNASVINEEGGVITGLNGSGVGSDAKNTKTTVTNYGTITGTYNDAYDFGDGDGVDIDYEAVINNYGTIQALGSKGTKPGEANPSTSEGIAAGGGTIVNGDATHTDALITGANNGLLIDDSNAGDAFYATQVTNYGTIRGLDGYAIKLVGSWDDTVTNYGTISGTSDTSVLLGGGNDTFNMYGGSVAGTVDAGAGSADTLNIDIENSPASPFLLGNSRFTGFEVTNIVNGVVALSDDYSSATSFTNAGSFSSTGAVTTSAFVNNGELYPGTVSSAGSASSIGTLAVTGDFTQGSAGTFLVGFSGSTGSFLKVSGAASLDGTITVGDLGTGFRADLTYTVLSATGGVSGTFASVENDLTSDLLEPVVTYNAGNVILGFDRTSVTYASLAGTPKSATLASVLDTIEASGTTNPDMLAVLGQLASYSGSDISAALDQVAPDTSNASGITMQQLTSLFQGNVFGHLGSVRAAWTGNGEATQLASSGMDGDLTASLIGAPSYRAGTSAGFWGRGFGSFGDVASDSGTSNGFSYRGGGFQGGYDMALGDTSSLGLSLGYARTDFSPDRVGSDGSSDSVIVGAYGTTLAGPVDLSGQISLAFNSFKTDRLVNLGTPVSAHSDYDGLAVGGSLEAGYAMTMGKAVIRPVAGLDATHLHTDSYTETGAGGYNLAIDANNDFQLRSTLGVQATGTLEPGFLGKVQPTADIRWGYDIRQADKGVTAAFAGAPASTFTLETNSQARNALLASFGAEAFVGEPLRIGIQASGDFRSGSEAFGIGAYLRYDW